MQYARVVGSATSTVKHSSLEGSKLLVVMALAADGRSPEGEPLLVVDRLGAGRGETVIISSDGGSARAMLKSKASPVRWWVVGIPDRS